MKRICIIATALLFSIALTQCEKEEQDTLTNESETVSITLDIKGNGASKMDVNTDNGEVTYISGDVIYVVSGGEYVGTLTHNGTNFCGSITNPTIGEPLYFYFLGNNTPTFNANNTGCTVDIIDQTEHLPVIECAPSNEIYASGMTTFTAYLLNKCALVKFNVTTASETATCVTGFNNKVTIDFTDTSFDYSKTNDGIIVLPTGNGEKWAILLPQENLEAGEFGSAYSQDGSYIGTCGAVPTIPINGYLTAGITVAVITEVNSGEVPVGAIRGKFTINANGNQVYFSRGNLQYQASTGIWRFAEHQWDYVGTQNPIYGDAGGTVSSSDNCYISSSYDGWIDLFGWGTSGYSHGSVCYQPWSTSMNNNDYYAYGSLINNLYDQTGQADWGYNAISNGGNDINQWRTLTNEEWFYVFNSRSASTINGISNARYAKAYVNNIHGVILFPDNYIQPYNVLQPIGINETGAVGWNGNNYTANDWYAMESNGAVFLPVTGYRDGTSVYDVGAYGNYWSSSLCQNLVYTLNFHDTYISQGGMNGSARYHGTGVRLVQNHVVP